MDDPRWQQVDAFFEAHLLPEDPALTAALDRNATAGLPAHDVSALQGSFLNLIARAMGAKRILEIGTLGGYSSIWFARAVGDGGRVVTLEVDPHHAETATANLETAGVAQRVDVLVGPATQSLEQLKAGGSEPFDLIFIDADKPNNPNYLAGALALSRPGTLIIADNVVRGGAVLQEDGADPRVVGVRRFMQAVRDEPRLSACALQTVGGKGWDGFAMLLVE